VRPDPEPQKPIRCIHREGAVVGTDAGGVKPADALEVQGGMPRIRLEELELLVRERPDIGRQGVVTRPEAGRGMMRQSFRERPAA